MENAKKRYAASCRENVRESIKEARGYAENVFYYTRIDRGRGIFIDDIEHNKKMANHFAGMALKWRRKFFEAIGKTAPECQIEKMIRGTQAGNEERIES